MLISPKSIFLCILAFVNFTFLAIVPEYIGIYHPKARVVLEDDLKIKGRLVKVGKFVSIIQEDEEKKLFNNSSKIAYVEEDMFKKSLKRIY